MLWHCWLGLLKPSICRARNFCSNSPKKISIRTIFPVFVDQVILPLSVQHCIGYVGLSSINCQENTRTGRRCTANWPWSERGLKYTIFSQPLQCNVRLLSWDVVYLSVVCNMRVLYPNGFLDQDATWYGGRPWPKWHCIRCGPSSTHPKGHSSPPQFFSAICDEISLY